MTAAFAIAPAGVEPAHGDYRIKWTCDAKGNWYRNHVLRSGNAEFIISRIPDPDLSPDTTAIEGNRK